MSDNRTLNRSFAGGEITPELFGRVDLVKFQTGLALCKNFRVLPHGPVVNREGAEYIIETRDSTKASRLVPFVLSDAVNYILEFGDQYIRFHTNGGTVVEPTQNITGITQATPGVVTIVAHGYSNGQWVYIDSVGGMTQVNGRFFKVAAAAANTFALQDMAGNNVSTTGYGAYTAGGTAARVYEIVSPYFEADLFNLHYAQATTKLPIVHATYAPRELVITTPTNWAISSVSFNTPLIAPVGVVATAPVGAGGWFHSYVVTTLDDAGNESPASSVSSIQNALYTAGNYNKIVWTTNGNPRYNVYKSTASAAAETGVIFGFIGTVKDTAVPYMLDTNITPDFGVTPPENQTIFASATNYPAAVSYFEQRRVFAGTTSAPQTTWLTTSATDSNMSKSFPTQDDDPITFRVAAREANQIKHLVPLDDLFMFTGSAVWRVFADNADALTPSNVTVRPLAYNGASMVQPVVTGSAVLFEENRSGHIIELRYQVERGAYETGDASIMAPHLFDGYTLRDLTFAGGRSKTCWTVRSDGTLLGMTYIPSQEVLGWHQHTTDGTFESCVTVQEGTEDATYVIVKRTINGRQVRYIERIKTRTPTVLVDAFYVDAGKTYRGPATATITNLHHLEGKTVNILADGVVHPQLTVTSGAITLNNPASTVTVGLPITAQLQTLPLAVLTAEAASLGIPKNVSRVNLRLKQSSGLYSGTTFAKMYQFKQRTSEPYGSPPALFTGVAPVPVSGQWTHDAQICLQQTDPLPVMVTALSIEVSGEN